MQDDSRIDGPSIGRLYKNQSDAKKGNFGGAPNPSLVKQVGDVKIETPGQVMLVSTGERLTKKEFLVVGYILDAAGTNRVSVIIKNNLDEVLDVTVESFLRDYNIVKTYPEGVIPELIYLDGVPDKIVSGQHWIEKDKTVVDPFTYAASNNYASDQMPQQIWEVQSVIDNIVTLHLIKQDVHSEDGMRIRQNTGKILQITKKDLVTNYKLHEFGFHLSDAFYRFIQNETYVAPENRDKIFMMGHGRKGEYVKMDDSIGPRKKSNEVKLDGF